MLYPAELRVRVKSIAFLPVLLRKLFVIVKQLAIGPCSIPSPFSAISGAHEINVF
jgi:hypothetical protein